MKPETVICVHECEHLDRLDGDSHVPVYAAAAVSCILASRRRRRWPLESLGGTISDAAKNTLYAGVEELEESGASSKDIRAFVDSELEASGIGGSPRSGQLVDMMA